MTHLVIHMEPATATDCCALCGKQAAGTGGPQLIRAEDRNRVCRNCGKKHAPSLVALLDLACMAERVGRIGRHTLVPPLSALLDLARAAEDYSHATPRRYQPVA